MSGGNNQIGPFFKEIIIIVLGVLIAVSVNNYMEKLKNQRFINKTLQATAIEFNQNEESVQQVMEKHIKMLDQLTETDTYRDDESIGEMITRLGGIQSPTIRNIGLRFFIASKAELIEYEMISMLINIQHE